MLQGQCEEKVVAASGLATSPDQSPSYGILISFSHKLFGTTSLRYKCMQGLLKVCGKCRFFVHKDKLSDLMVRMECIASWFAEDLLLG